MVDAQLGKASVAIRATLDQLDKDLAGARKKTDSAVSKMTKSAGKNFQTLGKVALGGVAAAGAAVAGLGAMLGGIIGKSTMAAAGVSEMNAVLHMLGERAGWSRGEVESNIQAMMDLGIRSDVANKVLAQFARQQLDVADATMAARTAQDLAVLSQRDSSETLDELIYFVQTQNSSLQVARDLGIQAGDALSQYADSVGKSVEELSQAERQQAMLNAVQEAGVKIAGTYETAMEEPGKAMRSLSRHFFEAQVAIGDFFLPAFGNVIEAVTQGIKGFRGLLEQGEPLGRIFGALGQIAEIATEQLFGLAGSGEGLYTTLERIAGIVEMVATNIQVFFGLIEMGYGPLEALRITLINVGLEGLAVVVEKIQEFITRAKEALAPVMQWIKENVKLQDILLALGAAIGSVIIPILASVIGAVAPVIAVFLVAVATVAALRAAWESNFLGIQDKTQAVLTFVRDFITTALSAIKTFWLAHGASIMAFVSQMFTTVQTVITTIVAAVKAVITTALDAIQSFWHAHGEDIMAFVSTMFATIETVISTIIQAIKTVITTTLTAIKSFWDAHGASIKAIAGAVWNAIQSTISTIINAVSAIINAVLGTIRGYWQAHGDTIMAVARNTWNTISTIVETMLGIIGDVIDAVAAAIQGDWETFGEKLRSIWQRSWDALTTILENAWDSIKIIVSDLVQTIKRFFTETDWGAVGKAVVQGIARGISNGASRVKDAAMNAARAAWEAVKGFFGIGSPAKLFIVIGENLMEGLAQGIDASESLPAKAIEGAVNKLADILTSVANVRGIAGSGNSLQQALDSLAQDVRIIVATMGEIAQQFEQEFLDKATAFADTVGKVTGVLKTAVEGLQAIGDYVSVGQSFAFGYIIPGLWAFEQDLQIVMTAMGRIAADFEEEFLEDVTAFAEATGKVTGVLQTAIDGLKAVGEYVAIGQSVAFGYIIPGLWAFEQDIKLVLEGMGRIAATMGDAAGLKSDASAVGAVAQALGQLAEQVQRFGDLTIKPIVEQLEMVRDTAQLVTDDITTAFATMAKMIANAVKTAVKRIMAALRSIPRTVTVRIRYDDPLGLLNDAMGGLSRPSLSGATLGGGGAGGQQEVHYHLEANYRYQDEVTLRDDVRFLSLVS